MNKDKKFEDEIKQYFETYMEKYLIERNYQEVIKLLHPEFTVIGTGKHEVGLTFEESLFLYNQEISQYPGNISYKIHFLKIFQITSTVALIVCGLEFIFKFKQIDYILENLRMSLLFVKEKGSWLIYHLHISQAQPDLMESESVPLKEMEKRNKWLEEELAERTQQLKEALEDTRIKSITDDLTKLNNRREFERIFKDAIEYSKKTGKPFCLILGDIDHFKNVNDVYGHLVGDKVLKEISLILSSQLRSSDSLSRWGGEEFIILLPNTHIKEAYAIAERLRKAVN
ncbi:MAG: diguanylate cyclase, partial [Fervidobacterium sp.]